LWSYSISIWLLNNITFSVALYRYISCGNPSRKILKSQYITAGSSCAQLGRTKKHGRHLYQSSIEHSDFGGRKQLILWMYHSAMEHGERKKQRFQVSTHLVVQTWLKIG
jgi:hypothetical protein